MRRLPLAGWLAADAVSITGTRVSALAIPWFVLATTDSPIRTGLVAAAEMLPLVLAKALCGPVLDRYGARPVAIVCDAASALAIMVIPVLHQTGALGYPGLVALVVLAGALRGPGDAAKAALTPRVAAVARVPLEQATGLSGAIERGSSMAGAAVAGVLIAVMGAADALWVNAATFVLSALILASMTRALGRGATPAADPAPYLEQLRDGGAFLRHDPVLLGMSVMVAITNLLDMAWSAVLLPVWGRESGYGAAAVGTLLALLSGASMVSALLAARWGDRMPRFVTYLVCFLITGFPRFVVLAVGAPLWLCAAVFVVSGLASGFLNPILGAVIFERIPEPLIGRVASLNTALAWSLMPLGGVLGGLLAGALTLSPALLVVGVAYLLATLMPLAVPGFRRFDERPRTASC